MYGVEGKGVRGELCRSASNVVLLWRKFQVSKGREHRFLSEMKALPKVVCSTQMMQRCTPWKAFIKGLSFLWSEIEGVSLRRST
jgi:hypothetical protein